MGENELKSRVKVAGVEFDMAEVFTAKVCEKRKEAQRKSELIKAELAKRGANGER